MRIAQTREKVYGLFSTRSTSHFLCLWKRVKIEMGKIERTYTHTCTMYIQITYAACVKEKNLVESFHVLYMCLPTSMR